MSLETTTERDISKSFLSEINLLKILKCTEKGHPHPSQVLIPYRPELDDVTVECSNCMWIYGRPPTSEEIQSYKERTNLD